MAQQPKAFAVLLEGLEEFTPSPYTEGVIPVPGHLITLFWLPLACGTQAQISQTHK